MQKNYENFGHGKLVTSVLNEPGFHDLDVTDQAYAAGEAIGCSVVRGLVAERGAEAMLNRYGEVGFWFDFIGKASEKMNPGLHGQLYASVERLLGEPVGKYEAESVPLPDYLDNIPPTETLAGYALPRLFTKQIGKNLPPEEAQDRLIRGLEVLDKAIPEAKTPEELLALTAEGLAEAHDVSAIVVLSTALPKDWLEEQNARQMLAETKIALQTKAPKLWEVYSRLTPEEKVQQKIL